MHKRFLVLVLFMLSGCIKAADEDEVREEPAVKAAMSAYVKCNREYVRKYAAQFGDPIALGRTAEAACYMTRMEITAAAKKVSDSQTADRITSEWKDQMIDLNAVNIATIRSR